MKISIKLPKNYRPAPVNGEVGYGIGHGFGVGTAHPHGEGFTPYFRTSKALAAAESTDFLTKEKKMEDEVIEGVMTMVDKGVELHETESTVEKLAHLESLIGLAESMIRKHGAKRAIEDGEAVVDDFCEMLSSLCGMVNEIAKHAALESSKGEEA